MSDEETAVLDASKAWFDAKMAVHFHGISAMSDAHKAEMALLDRCKDLILAEERRKSA